MGKRLKRYFRRENITDSLIFLLYLLAVGGSLAVCLVYQYSDYPRKTDFLPNILLLCLGSAGMIGLALCVRAGARLMRPVSVRRKLLIFLMCSVMLTAVQAVAARAYYFYSGWDVRNLQLIIESLLSGQPISEDLASYLSIYPNNLLLIRIYIDVIRLSQVFGGDYNYFAQIAFQCGLSWLTGVLLFDIIRRETGSLRTAATAYGVYWLLIGLSPWVSIPYSDSVALVFPTAILWMYIRQPKKPFAAGAKWFLLAALTYVGFRIKPQTVLVTLAVALYELGRLIPKRAPGKRRFLPFLGRAGAFSLGLLAAIAAVSASVDSLGVELDEEQQFGPAHYLMMGMNPNAKGWYDADDVAFSHSIPTAQARAAIDLKTAQERIRAMGLGGFLTQMRCKTLINYNDGTFFWGGEGGFFRDVLPETIPVLSPLLRSFYYGPDFDDGGSSYPVWSNFEQAVWLSVLLFSLLAAGTRKPAALVPMLSIAGLTVFQLLFEARSRYLYCYAPFYILLAAFGLSAAGRRALDVRNRRQC